MDIITTHSTTPQKSMYVPRKKTISRAKVMLVSRPTSSTGMAMARLGHMRWLMSYPISRPLSDEPKSNRNSLTDLSKKMVSVTLAVPAAAALNIRGRSYPRSAFQFSIASGVTRLTPRCSLAMSSGEFTTKKRKKVSRFTPIRIGMA